MVAHHGIRAKIPPEVILDALTFPLLVLDADVRVMHHNRAAAEMLGARPDTPLHGLFGEVLHCVRTLMAHRDCGAAPECDRCVVRKAVLAAIHGTETSRQVLSMEVQDGDDRRQVWLRVSASPFESGGRSLALVTLEDVSELVQLRRLIPMCASCRRVRYKDEDYWHEVEDYLLRYTAISFTHGICPDCARRLYPELTTDTDVPPASPAAV